MWDKEKEREKKGAYALLCLTAIASLASFASSCLCSRTLSTCTRLLGLSFNRQQTKPMVCDKISTLQHSSSLGSYFSHFLLSLLSVPSDQALSAWRTSNAINISAWFGSIASLASLLLHQLATGKFWTLLHQLSIVEFILHWSTLLVVFKK